MVGETSDMVYTFVEDMYHKLHGAKSRQQKSLEEYSRVYHGHLENPFDD